MAFLSELDVINDMLGSLGEAPLNALDEEHPLVPAGVRMLRVASFREQAKSWWFNQEIITLSPDATSGFVYTPDDAIRVDPTDGTSFIQRGNKLYRPYGDASDRYVFTSKVECVLVRLIPFEDLPPSAALLVSTGAQKDFQRAYDADQLKYAQIVQDYRDAFIQCNAEHIRNRGANLLTKPSTAAIMNHISPAPNNGRLPIYQ